MLSTFGALLRISLRRSRADWPIVAAAALVCLLAATVLAAGSIYGSAVAVAGLHRALADASPDDGTITASGWIPPGQSGNVDAAVTGELERTFGPGSVRIVRSGRSGTYALPGQPADAVRELAILGTAEDLAGHARLTAGAWPQDESAAGAVIPVAISTDVSSRLGLEVGRRLALDSRLEPGAVTQVQVTGIFVIEDPADPYWRADGQVLDGVTLTDQYDTYGPLFTTDRALLASSGDRVVRQVWQAVPVPAALGLSETEAVRARTLDLPARVEAAVGDLVSVRTGLADLLARTDRSLLVTRTGVLLLTLQLVILAAYAAMLSASLLVEHRRVGTAILRSRGAGSATIATLALIEGGFIAIGAVLLAPWLAMAGLHVLNVTGPLADVALTIDPSVSVDAFVAAAVGAGICLAALTLPALRARSITGVHGDVARAETRGLAQRLGLDVALLAVAVVGLWQLRVYGAPLTRSVRGVLGLDPLLIAAPAIGLLAGAIIALRLVPLLARLIERLARGRRGLVPSLGARQLARRPLRYSRSAMLLVLAMAMGVFAVAYARTWSARSRTRPASRSGRTCASSPGGAAAAPPRASLDGVYATLPGVTARMAVDRQTLSGLRTSRSGKLLSIDADRAPGVVQMRPDLSDRPIEGLMAPLIAGRPSVEAVRLPDGARQLRFTLTAAIGRLEHVTFDDETGEQKTSPATLAEIAGWRAFAVSVVIRDARGVFARVEGGSATIDPGPHEVVVSLAPSAGEVDMSSSIELFAIEVAASLPDGFVVPAGTLAIADLAAAGPDGSWRSVPLDLGTGWRATASGLSGSGRLGPSGIHGPVLTVPLVGDDPVLFGNGDPDRHAIVTLAPADLDRLEGAPIPIVASDAFLSATASRPGDVVNLVVDGANRIVTVSGTVRAFPGTGPDDATAVMDLRTRTLLAFADDGTIIQPTEWWLSIAPGSAGRVTASLAHPPIASATVVAQDQIARSLAADPIALGIIGGLAIGFAAAATFAIIGFIVSASVSARERITEFALLRALGLSSRQLSIWLSLENTVLAAVSLVAGIVLGAVIAWLVLPFITVTQSAATPYPPVEIDVPWTLVAVLAAACGLALAATVASLAWLLPRIGLAAVLRAGEE